MKEPNVVAEVERTFPEWFGNWEVFEMYDLGTSLSVSLRHHDTDKLMQMDITFKELSEL